MKRIAIIGAGWAGLACAVHLTQAGHHATVLEASRTTGGRARALNVRLPDASEATLDNGQHILIGAYEETLKLMRTVGVDTNTTLLRMPLTLRYPDGAGLQLPHWKRPWFAGLDVAAGILRAQGWTWRDKLSLLRTADAWRRASFTCAATHTVAKLCSGISPRVMAEMIDPLVVSALNTPTDHASGQVFLRIMQDALFAQSADGPGSNLLLPRADLGQIFPDTACAWLRTQGADIRLGHRVGQIIQQQPNSELLHNQERTAQVAPYKIDDCSDLFDAVIIATPVWEALRLANNLAKPQWLEQAGSLQHEAITTVYAHSLGATLPQPMLALRGHAPGGTPWPAQFVFDRGALTGHAGLLAFVVSASQGDAATLEGQVIHQGRTQLNLPRLQAIKTIVEKRATFACTPLVQRPGMALAPGVWACGDYVQGPYPSTLEAAVRSGLAAAQAVNALG